MEKKTPYNPNNKTELPLNHYLERFRAGEPEEMSARTGAAWDGEKFTLRICGEEKTVTWPDFSDPGWTDTQRILFLRYLLEGVKAPRSNAYLTYREMPWGEVYDTNFKGRCLSRLCRMYGASPERFSAACLALGGLETESSGLGYALEFLPGLWLRFFLWEGDEEFPASAQILFSDNFPAVFSAEDRVVVCEYVIGKMKSVD